MPTETKSLAHGLIGTNLVYFYMVSKQQRKPTETKSLAQVLIVSFYFLMQNRHSTKTRILAQALLGSIWVWHNLKSTLELLLRPRPKHMPLLVPSWSVFLDGRSLTQLGPHKTAGRFRDIQKVKFGSTKFCAKGDFCYQIGTFSKNH